MCPVDEYGVEYDADVEAALKDPKATLLAKLLDYRDRRNAAKRQKEEEEALKHKKNESIFNGIFS